MPTGQSEQVAEPVPLLDRPAEQTVQGELPDAAARPATQAVQEPASAPEEVPPGQSEQAAEPAPLLDWPARQMGQVEFEVAPVAVETRPATQKNKTDQLRSAFDGERAQEGSARGRGGNNKAGLSRSRYARALFSRGTSER